MSKLAALLSCCLFFLRLPSLCVAFAPTPRFHARSSKTLRLEQPPVWHPVVAAFVGVPSVAAVQKKQTMLHGWLRCPKTTKERRWAHAWDHEGILPRPRRNAKNLPNEWDDILIIMDRSWKSQSKRRHQWKPQKLNGPFGWVTKSRKHKYSSIAMELSVTAAPSDQEEEEEEPKKNVVYRVILYKDSVHTFNYIVRSLIKIIDRMDRKAAFEICVQVQKSGNATVTKTSSRSEAETICLGLERQGLTVSIETDEEVSE